MQAQIASAAFRAQAILAALNMRDTVCIQQELQRLEAARTRASDSLEAERLDLLAEIARELCENGASSDICRSLLQHTAATALAAGFRAACLAPFLQ